MWALRPHDAQQTAAEATSPAVSQRWRNPRERVVDSRRVIVDAPQIRIWDNFEHFTAQAAVEFLEKDAAAPYSIVEQSGDTEGTWSLGAFAGYQKGAHRVIGSYRHFEINPESGAGQALPVAMSGPVIAYGYSF